MRIEAVHGVVDAFIVKRAGVVIENSFLISGDGERHDFAAPRLRELGVDVDERLEVRNAVGGASGDDDRGRSAAGFAEDVVVQHRRRFEPHATAGKLE